MKKQLCFFLALIGLATSAQAADLERGKSLHNENCTHCHISMMGGDGSAIYTRENRRIESLDALRKQVNRCKDSLGASWPPDQIDDVVFYLNQTYYKFEE
ncbi:MAG: cytochrome c [Proteobacteria bacterium]|jgi:mono/diheme cytochrome c family protein|nr:cytochrome c [Pseudomonadota bacterium]MCG6934988.1 cytochrome c [Pseudomonadota bacterium]